MNEIFSENNPHDLFNTWFLHACNNKTIKEPTAMCLATYNMMPSARMVLLKHHDERGFVFFTNLESRKSDEIRAQHKAALCFYWEQLDRQIRIVGTVEAVSTEEADAYFVSRSRGSQIGAWASQQSRPMQQRDELAQRITHFEQEFEGNTVPRPPHWSGWRVVPSEMEFWEQGESRLHERVRFLLRDGEWEKDILYP